MMRRDAASENIGLKCKGKGVIGYIGRNDTGFELIIEVYGLVGSVFSFLKKAWREHGFTIKGNTGRGGTSTLLLI